SRRRLEPRAVSPFTPARGGVALDAVPLGTGAAGAVLQTRGGPAGTAFGVEARGARRGPECGAFSRPAPAGGLDAEGDGVGAHRTRVAECAEQVMRGGRDLDTALAALDADVDRIL